MERAVVAAMIVSIVIRLLLIVRYMCAHPTCPHLWWGIHPSRTRTKTPQVIDIGGYQQGHRAKHIRGEPYAPLGIGD
jgi:hypothetical protein